MSFVSIVRKRAPFVSIVGKNISKISQDEPWKVKERHFAQFFPQRTLSPKMIGVINNRNNSDFRKKKQGR